jgi:hypothetical protein
MIRRNRWQQGWILGAVALLTLAAGCNDEESPDATPPPIPTGVYSVTGDHYVDIYWSPILGVDDLAGYGVYRSSTEQGPYHKLAEIPADAETQYRDDDAQNGVTYFYAVDAFDHDGNESDLSLETVFDTPRPAGTNLRLHAREASLALSGLDFSAQPNPNNMRVAWDDPQADIYVYLEDLPGEGDALRVVGTQIEGAWTDLQDVGWTASLDEVNYAPELGWDARSPLGLELVEGHSYIVWTWDNYFAKFRVTSLNTADGYAMLDWAYQADPGNPELVRPVMMVEGR